MEAMQEEFEGSITEVGCMGEGVQSKKPVDRVQSSVVSIDDAGECDERVSPAGNAENVRLNNILMGEIVRS